MASRMMASPPLSGSPDSRCWARSCSTGFHPRGTGHVAAGRDSLGRRLACRGWFPTDAVEHGTLLALDDDGRALVAFNYSDDLRSVGRASTRRRRSWRAAGSCDRRRVGDASPCLPNRCLSIPTVGCGRAATSTARWPPGLRHGPLRGRRRLTSNRVGVPQRRLPGRGRARGRPTGPRVKLEASPNFYVTDRSSSGPQSRTSVEVWRWSRSRMASPTVLEPWTSGTRVPSWIHRDLCAEASGGEAYTFVLLTGEVRQGHPRRELRAVDAHARTRSARTHAGRFPSLPRCRWESPPPACRGYGANGVKLGEARGAVGYRTRDGYEVVQRGDYSNHGDVYLSPDYVVGVPLPLRRRGGDGTRHRRHHDLGQRVSLRDSQIARDLPDLPCQRRVRVVPPGRRRSRDHVARAIPADGFWWQLGRERPECQPTPARRRTYARATSAVRSPVPVMGLVTISTSGTPPRL